MAGFDRPTTCRLRASPGSRLRWRSRSPPAVRTVAEFLFPERVHGNDLLRVVGERERLLETNGVGRRVFPRRKRFPLDLIEPLLVIEHRDRRMAAIRPHDAQLTAVSPADAVGNIDLDLAPLGQRLDR